MLTDTTLTIPTSPAVRNQSTSAVGPIFRTPKFQSRLRRRRLPCPDDPRGNPLPPIADRPAIPGPAASTSDRSSFPEWVLLDNVAHEGRCHGNETTAVTATSTGTPIEVSFVVADPPALTRCIFHCPELPSADFLQPHIMGADGTFYVEQPRIIGADGAFLLLCVFFPDKHHTAGRPGADLFVYDSGLPGAPPSLELIPQPYPVGYLYKRIGVLSRGDHCLVGVYQQRIDADARRRTCYDLHVFSSRTKSWSTKVARQARGTHPPGCRFHPNKAFAVEGESMAWVDLRNGILLCDAVAGDDPEVRLIELPLLMPVNFWRLGVESSFGTLPGLDMSRDVTFKNGWFRFVEMGFPQVYENEDGGQRNFRWTAAMFKMMIRSDRWEWEFCSGADSGELAPASGCIAGDLFPEVWDSEEEKLTLNNVFCHSPTLDLYDDDVVYMMANMKAQDRSGWVVSVNTKRKLLERMLTFEQERIHFLRIYRQCAFSKHLSKAPG